MNVTVVSLNNEQAIVQISDGGIPFATIKVDRKKDPNHFDMLLKYDRDVVICVRSSRSKP